MVTETNIQLIVSKPVQTCLKLLHKHITNCLKAGTNMSQITKETYAIYMLLGPLAPVCFCIIFCCNFK
jgi:hypothetical protein